MRPADESRSPADRLARWRAASRLSRRELAERLRTTAEVVRRWEEGRSWPRRPLRDRLEELLRTPPPEPPPEPSGRPARPTRTGSTHRRTRGSTLAGIGERLRAAQAEGLPGEPVPLDATCAASELRALLERYTKDPLAVAALERLLAWDGGGGASLTEAGAAGGCSREWVRLLVIGLPAHLQGAPPRTPHLDRALERARTLVPCEAEAVEREVLGAGLTTRLLRAEGLASAALLLGRRPAIQVRRLGDARVATHEDDDLSWLDRGVDLVRRARGALGCVRLDDLLAELHGTDPHVPEATLARLLPLRGARPLDAAQRWWAHGEPTSASVIEQARRLLGVGRSMSVVALRAALERCRKRASSCPIPSEDRLLELCGLYPDLRVDGRVVSVGPAFVERSLAPLEQLVVASLAAGPLRPAEFKRAMEARGARAGSTQWSAAKNPFVLRRDGLLYRLDQLPPDWTPGLRGRQAAKVATSVGDRDAVAAVDVAACTSEALDPLTVRVLAVIEAGVRSSGVSVDPESLPSLVRRVREALGAPPPGDGRAAPATR